MEHYTPPNVSIQNDNNVSSLAKSIKLAVQPNEAKYSESFINRTRTNKSQLNLSKAEMSVTTTKGPVSIHNQRMDGTMVVTARKIGEIIRKRNRIKQKLRLLSNKHSKHGKDENVPSAIASMLLTHQTFMPHFSRPSTDRDLVTDRNKNKMDFLRPNNSAQILESKTFDNKDGRRNFKLTKLSFSNVPVPNLWVQSVQNQQQAHSPLVPKPALNSETLKRQILKELKRDVTQLVGMKMKNITSENKARFETLVEQTSEALKRHFSQRDPAIVSKILGDTAAILLEILYNKSVTATTRTFQSALTIWNGTLLGEVWSAWGAWSGCSVTCGVSGHRERKRGCVYLSGKKCLNVDKEDGSCNFLKNCPVSATWSAWGSWHTCSATCDRGFTHRHRQCRVTGESKGICKGRKSEVKHCKLRRCFTLPRLTLRRPGHWSMWNSWSDCSVTCGEGLETKKRQCTAGPRLQKRIKMNMLDPTCPGKESATRPCILPACNPAYVAELKRVQEGSDATLQCRFDQSEVRPVYIYWITPGGKKITKDTMNSRYILSGDTLVVKKAQEFDRGMYHCIIVRPDSRHLTGDSPIDVITCQSKPCMNGGTCLESKMGIVTPFLRFSCQCSNEFEGNFCEKKKFSSNFVFLIVGIVLSVVVGCVLGLLSCIICRKGSTAYRKKTEKRNKKKLNENKTDKGYSNGTESKEKISGKYSSNSACNKIQVDKQSAVDSAMSDWKQVKNSSVISSDDSCIEIAEQDYNEFNFHNGYNMYQNINTGKTADMFNHVPQAVPEPERWPGSPMAAYANLEKIPTTPPRSPAWDAVNKEFRMSQHRKQSPLSHPLVIDLSTSSISLNISEKHVQPRQDHQGEPLYASPVKFTSPKTVSFEVSGYDQTNNGSDINKQSNKTTPSLDDSYGDISFSYLTSTPQKGINCLDDAERQSLIIAAQENLGQEIDEFESMMQEEYGHFQGYRESVDVRWVYGQEKDSSSPHRNLPSIPEQTPADQSLHNWYFSERIGPPGEKKPDLDIDLAPEALNRDKTDKTKTLISSQPRHIDNRSSDVDGAESSYGSNDQSHLSPSLQCIEAGTKTTTVTEGISKDQQTEEVTDHRGLVPKKLFPDLSPDKGELSVSVLPESMSPRKSPAVSPRR